MGVVPQRVIGTVLVDGSPTDAAKASVSALDIGIQRGYGCFEALRAYGGRPFRSAGHVARLRASADKLAIPLPSADDLKAWIADRAAAGGDCVVRVLVTGGTDPTHPGTDSRVIVIAEEVPAVPAALRVLPVDAPWHADGVSSELTGAKTLSYGPNLAATLLARRAGFDDALLIGRSGSVLEGPTYGFAWVTDGVVETPSLDLGILASITRSALLEVADTAGIRLEAGRYSLERVLAADEVLALSTIKEIAPVMAVGDRDWDPGPVTAQLADAFSSLVKSELSAS